MIERFGVKPLGGLDVGAKMTSVIEGGRKQNRLNEWNDEAPDIIKSGDPRKIADLMSRYPEMQPQIAAASGYEDITLLKESVDLSKEILTGATDPKQALAMHIQQGQARGEDVTKYVNLLGKEIATPGAAKQWADRWLAMQDSAAHKQLNAGTGQGSTTDIGNYVSLAAENIRQTEGREPTPRELMDATLEVKRAQTSEVARNTLAKKVVELEMNPQVVAATKASELGTELKLKPEIESEVTRARGVESRASELITRGVLAAESTAVLRRGISLLEKVETGGIDAVKHAAKRFFGVEGADEGELSNNLSKAVLSQLRETFGAQFTVEEGNRLTRIEAGFTKSPANNKRLLTQALKMAERTANRAKKAAKKRGDSDTVTDISDLLSFSFGDPTDLPEGVTEEDVALTMKNNNMTREEVLTRLKGGQ